MSLQVVLSSATANKATRKTIMKASFWSNVFSLCQFSTSSTPKPPANSSYNSVWKSLRAPSLFGVGLYLGLMVFGDSKEESATFTEMKTLFWKDGEGRRGE